MSKLSQSDFPNVSVRYNERYQTEPETVTVENPLSVEIVKDNKAQSLHITIQMPDGKVMKLSTGGHNGYLDIEPLVFGETKDDLVDRTVYKRQP